MSLRPDLEALIQGALDDTLTPEEREGLDRLMTESVEVRGRAAHLKQLTDLLDSLGPADPPATLVQDVLAQISNPSDQQSAGASDKFPAETQAGTRVAAFPVTRNRPSVHKRGMAVNKKILLGLAAAAVLVLGVLTFVGSPPATGGTEATIGAAQRAQSPQIEAKDVVLGDTSAQEVLQTETWDQIIKDDGLRTALQDPNVRAMLENAELRQALAHPDILRALRDPMLVRRLNDAALVRMLNDAALLKKLDDAALVKELDDANLRSALRNQAFVDALRNDAFRAQLVRADVAAALSRSAFQNALRDRGFDAALRSPRFAEAMVGPGNCPKWLCGGNSPIIDGARID